MQVLLDSNCPDVLVDFYLFEEARDQAIGVADETGDWNYSLIEKVADAVLPFHPDWVNQASRKQAEGLIAKPQSKYYVIAALIGKDETGVSFIWQESRMVNLHGRAKKHLFAPAGFTK